MRIGEAFAIPHEGCIMGKISKWAMIPTAILFGMAMAVLGADTELKVKEGDKAPNIALPAAQIEKALPDSKDKVLDLKSLQGKKNVVLFFYPKAMTKGCTIESCGFRDVNEKFAAVDTVVIGISIDKLEDQEKFITKEKLNFALLADTEGKITKELGVLNDNGKTSKRVTFVIDKEGVIRKIYTKVDTKAHPAEVLEFIKTLK